MTELQRQILHALRDVHPERLSIDQLPAADDRVMQSNLRYLAEHGLIEALDAGTFADPAALDQPRITAVGLDFLTDDGGVSAQLRTVTVKFDAEDLRTLLSARIAASDLSADEQHHLEHAIRSLPAKALQTFLDQFVRQAVARWPDALQQLQTWVNQVS